MEQLNIYQTSISFAQLNSALNPVERTVRVKHDISVGENDIQYSFITNSIK